MAEQKITVDLLDPLFPALDDPNKGVSLQVIETLSRVLTLNISSEARALTKEKCKRSRGLIEKFLPVAGHVA